MSSALAGAETVLPAQALLLDAGAFRLGADQCRVARAVGFAKGVSASDQRDRFFIVHRHAGKGLADIPGPKPAGSGLPFGPSGFT